MGYLDYAGLQYLWGKLKEKFAPKSHSHDDRYYTESEMNTKLSGKSNTDHTHNTSSISSGNVNYAGYAGPIESAHIDVLRANRLAFLPASGVKVEYSVDSGATWIDYGATDAQKASLFAMRMGSAAPFYTGKHTKKEECTTKDQLRITVTPVDRYASVNMLYLWVSVAGTTATVNISRSTIGAKDTFTDVRTDVPISGWSGPNEIRFSQGTFGGGSTQTSNQYAYRFTFKNKADAKGSVSVMDIRMYGSSAWSVPNSMMEKDHLYNWDTDKNAFFPAQVTATKFNGSSTGVVDYGNAAGATIKVGFNGAGLTKDNLTHIAGYAKDGKQTVIKDVDRGVLQSWLNLNEMINTQLTTGSSTPSDNDFYISQYAGGGATTTTYHRRPISALWNYIKSKADAVYSAKSHTHTKSQITDFPASLKNPTALTIQTNGTTAATYDGSAAKTVNVTKSNIGLGNVDNTADKNKSVASAAKLTTARTVSGGSDITLSFNYDGSGNSTANIGFYSCKHLVGNTKNYPFHRFAKLDNLTGAYTDRTMLVYITQDYNGGGFGICRLSLRTNSSSFASTVEAKWLVRSSLSSDFVQVAIYNVYGKTYADAFIKINETYGNTTISALESGTRGIQRRTWTLVDSNEVNGTTATDKKTSSECWKTIAEAGVAIHNQAYSSSASATDNGYTASSDSANSAASCTGNSASATKLTSSAGSAVQPVYFKDGKPVATTYFLNKTVPADAKFTDTNTWRGVQNNLTSTATDQSLSAAQGKVLKDLVDGKAAASHTHNYAGATSSGGSANSAVKLDTSTAGSPTKPVYFSGGKPIACSYTLNKTVPADAKFTDTTYGTFKGATSNAAGTSGLVPTPAAGAQTKYLRADGTWQTPPDTNTTYDNMSGATTSAAGKAGLVPAPAAGAANRYLRSDGTWQVPPDTNTWRGIQNSLTSNSTTDSLSAAQGKELKTLVDGKADKNHSHSYLPLSGGAMIGYLNFGQSNTGLSWTCANGDIYDFRAYSPNSVFQLTRQNPSGVGEYGVFNVYGDGSANITALGSLNFTVGGVTRSLLDWTYPVGSIYLSVDATSPAAKFGGTWTPIENLFLYPVPTNTAAGLQGGEASHTLTVAEMPSHTHKTYMAYGDHGAGPNIPIYERSTNRCDGYATLPDTSAVGGNTAHNNMPPYLTMYAWYRVG